MEENKTVYTENFQKVDQNQTKSNKDDKSLIHFFFSLLLIIYSIVVYAVIYNGLSPIDKQNFFSEANIYSAADKCAGTFLHYTLLVIILYIIYSCINHKRIKYIAPSMILTFSIYISLLGTLQNGGVFAFILMMLIPMSLISILVSLVLASRN